jgi:hypothetical protein
MRINVVYYVFLGSNTWKEVVSEQLNVLKSSGLYDDSSKIHIVVNGNKKELNELQLIIKNGYSKIQISDFTEDNSFEYIGFKEIYSMSKEKDSLILYFHTKGVTSKKNKLRRILEKYTIVNYSTYVDEFKKNKDLDVGCLIPHEEGFAYFNFFWVRSDYINKFCYEPKILNNRFYWETWIGNKNCKKMNVNKFSPLKILPIKSDGNYRTTHLQVNNIINNLENNF